MEINLGSIKVFLNYRIFHRVLTVLLELLNFQTDR